MASLLTADREKQLEQASLGGLFGSKPLGDLQGSASLENGRGQSRPPDEMMSRDIRRSRGS